MMGKTRKKASLSIKDQWHNACAHKKKADIDALIKDKTYPEGVLDKALILKYTVSLKWWDVLDALEKEDAWLEVFLYGTLKENDKKPGSELDGILSELALEHPDQNQRVLRLLDTLPKKQKTELINQRNRILNEDYEDDPDAQIIGHSSLHPLLYYVICAGNVALYDPLIERGGVVYDYNHDGEMFERKMGESVYHPVMAATRFTTTQENLQGYFLSKENKAMLVKLVSIDPARAHTDIQDAYKVYAKKLSSSHRHNVVHALNLVVLCAEMLTLMGPAAPNYRIYASRIAVLLMVLAVEPELNMDTKDSAVNFRFETFYRTFRAEYLEGRIRDLAYACKEQNVYLSSLLIGMNDKKSLDQLADPALYTSENLKAIVGKGYHVLARNLATAWGYTTQEIWEKLTAMPTPTLPVFLKSLLDDPVNGPLNNTERKLCDVLNDAASCVDTDKLGIAEVLILNTTVVYTPEVFKAVFSLKGKGESERLLQAIFSRPENIQYLEMAISQCESLPLRQLLFSMTGPADSTDLFALGFEEIVRVQGGQTKQQKKENEQRATAWIRKHMADLRFLPALLNLNASGFENAIKHLSPPVRANLLRTSLNHKRFPCSMNETQLLNLCAFPVFVGIEEYDIEQRSNLIVLAKQIADNDDMLKQKKQQFFGLMGNNIWLELFADYIIHHQEDMERENLFRVYQTFLRYALKKPDSCLPPTVDFVATLVEMNKQDKVLAMMKSIPRTDVAIAVGKCAIVNSQDLRFKKEADTLIKELTPQKENQAPRHSKAAFLKAYKRMLTRGKKENGAGSSQAPDQRQQKKPVA